MKNYEKCIVPDEILENVSGGFEIDVTEVKKFAVGVTTLAFGVGMIALGKYTEKRNRKKTNKN